VLFNKLIDVSTSLLCIEVIKSIYLYYKFSLYINKNLID